MNILFYIKNLFKKLEVQKLKLFDGKPNVGDKIDVVYLNGCMDTEYKRVKGEIMSREDSYIERRWSPHPDNQTYIYEIITEEQKLTKTHSSWVSYSKENKVWEFRT